MAGEKVFMSGRDSIHIQAPPEHVYALLSEVTRMGEYSPECIRCVWLGGASSPSVGARFKGTSRWKGMSWTRTCEVVVAEPGREFAFRTIPTPLLRDSTVWRYRFDPAEGGTLLTESFEVVRLEWPMWLFEVVSGRPRQMPNNLRTTLERIKAAAEQSASRVAPA